MQPLCNFGHKQSEDIQAAQVVAEKAVLAVELVVAEVAVVVPLVVVVAVVAAA